MKEGGAMVKLTPKMIVIRVLTVSLLVALFTAVAIYYKNTVFA